ncbi:hypothetical protein BN1723_017513, partial [Verticillium longisporum]
LDGCYKSCNSGSHGSEWQLHRDWFAFRKPQFRYRSNHRWGQDITALVRPSSLEKKKVLDLQKRGVKIASFDIDGPEDATVTQLQGFDASSCAASSTRCL